MAGIVRNHRSLLTHYSKPGQGACFRIYFRPDLQATPMRVSNPPLDLTSKHQGTVLVVDDEPTIRMVLAKLLVALAKHTYWFLVLRKDLGAQRGDVSKVKGLRIGAAPGVDLSFKHLLRQAGVDPDRDNVQVGPVPGTADSVSFGVTAAKALEEGRLDGFWANGMGAEVAVERGVGTIVLDLRRGVGPAAAQHYTFGALVTTDRLIQENPKAAAAAVRAIVRAQQALREDPNRATAIGQMRFPPQEASLIAELIRRDLPYYDPTITPETVASMNQFAMDIGLLKQPKPYDQIVATQFSGAWNA